VKKSALLVTLFLIMLVRVSTAPPGISGQAADYAVSAKRVVTIHEGYIVMNDTFTLSPAQGIPTFMVGIPKNLSAHAVRSYLYPRSVSSTGERLAIEWLNASGEFDWITIRLTAASGGFTFSVVQAYSNVFSPTSYGEPLELILPVIPALKSELNSCYTEIRFDRWWKVQTVPSGYNQTKVGNVTALSHTYGVQPANSDLTIQIGFDSLREERYMVTQASRVIELNSFTGLTVTDRFSVKALTYNTGGSITFYILVKASDVSVGDSIGAFLPETESTTRMSMFEVSYPSNSSLALVSVYPRYPIYPDQNYSFYVRYRLPFENASGLSPFGRTVSFALPATNNFTSYADNFTLEALLPVGAKLAEVRLGEYKLENERSDPISFKATIGWATEEMFDSPVVLTYSFDTLWAGYVPSVAVASIFAVGLAYALTRRERVPEARAAPVEFEAVVKFVDRQREKMRLEQALERLQEDLRNNRITRQEYKARSRIQSQRLEEVTRSIPPLKNQATKANRAVADIIAGIEVSEAEIMSMNSVIRDLKSQFSQKRISRAAYAKLLDNYVKKVHNERTSIGAALNELDNLSRA